MWVSFLKVYFIVWHAAKLWHFWHWSKIVWRCNKIVWGNQDQSDCVDISWNWVWLYVQSAVLFSWYSAKRWHSVSIKEIITYVWIFCCNLCIDRYSNHTLFSFPNSKNHMICVVPPYEDLHITEPVDVFIMVKSNGRVSEPSQYSYLPGKTCRPRAILMVSTIFTPAQYPIHARSDFR